ncbi:MAG: topoisomerase C-terminal repeat-containing protein, partial [Akkermansia sp.]
MISGREMADEELKTLIVDGKTGILQGFTSRFGKPFEAGLELNDKCRAALYFPAREEDESTVNE